MTVSLRYVMDNEGNASFGVVVLRGSMPLDSQNPPYTNSKQFVPKNEFSAVKSLSYLSSREAWEGHVSPRTDIGVFARYLLNRRIE